MGYPVIVTENAILDIEDIYRYIEHVDGETRADAVITMIEKTLASLSKHPQRGVYPPELIELGNREYREVFFKPYRIIYRVIEKQVYIVLIADGRRDLQTLFQQRLFQA